MVLQAGQPVRVEFTKWDGREHWAYDGRYLGSDAYGDWIGHPAGTLMARPGLSLSDTRSWLTLVPAGGRPWLAAFNAPGHRLRIYIDLTTVPSWQDTVLRTIDMDLDVVVPQDGRDPFIDDEDEFAEHRELFGYPPDVVTLTEQAAKELLVAVIAEEPPFDQTADRWFDRLAELRS
jgi:hypothetical protein